MSTKKSGKKDKLKEGKNHDHVSLEENGDSDIKPKKPGRKGKRKATSEDDIENSILSNNVDGKEGITTKRKKKKVTANNNLVDSNNVSPTFKNKKQTKAVLEENNDKVMKKVKKEKILNDEEMIPEDFNQESVSFELSDKDIKVALSDAEDGEVDVKPDIKDLEKKKEEIMWSNEDLMVLVANMEKLIPENDNLAFTTRSEKLEWDKVIFKHYTIEECKKTWGLLSKKIRKYRLLHEVLNDARELIVNPPNQKKKHKVHPDMPKRPLSSYLLFYLQKKDKIIQENPGIELTEITKKIGQVYKSLPPEKKAVYEKLAAHAKEVYEEKMKQFYLDHPEFKVKPAPAPKPVKQRAPKRPLTPFGCFYQSELLKNNVPDNEKHQFKEQCKEKWKQMSDKKKLGWITWAEEKQIEYEKDLQSYQASHPDYVVNHGTKLVLTKEELLVKERVAGKPIKPPNTAYALFARNVLSSQDVKCIPTKERLNFVSAQWKNCSEEEKQQFRQLHANLMDQYKIDFAHYLETLPEDKRKLEMEKSAPKRRKSEDNHKESKKRKRKEKVEEKPKANDTKAVKFKEPEQPPISAFKYFAKCYTGKDSVQHAWKKLSQSDKEKWERELIQKKHEYIADFEKFLKSLSKEELAAFSHARNQAKQQPQEISEEEDELDESGEESDSDNSGSDSDSDDSSDDE